MKVYRLYSNFPERFVPIDFASGLNVVLGEIRLPRNRNRDTHNLGKTTLGRLLDYAFLLGRDPKFFLFKHQEVFNAFVFFLEVQLADESYLTIRRGVEEASKVSFKKHEAPHQDFTALPVDQWDHGDVPFDRARELLDSLLDWRSLKPWGYRKVLGYLIRSQDDFQDVFQLKKFGARHSDWKPFLAHLLGFDAGLVQAHYDVEDRLSELKNTAATVNAELGGSIQDISKVEGLILLKQKETEKKQALLDAFDFRAQDKERTKQLVDETDERISELNARRYSLQQNRRKITNSLEEDQILFDPESAQKLFAEAGVLFRGQIKRDYEQLIEFNKAITEERRGYLIEERADIDTELKRINAELNNLGKRRSDALAFLSETDPFAKYKQVSDELVSLRTDVKGLERQREYLHKLQELRSEIRAREEEVSHLQTRIEADVERQNTDQTSLFSTIRLFFNEIVEEVIDRKVGSSRVDLQACKLEYSIVSPK